MTIFGLSRVLATDIGRQLDGIEFSTYLKNNGVKYITPPPGNIQINILIENVVNKFKNNVKTLADLNDPNI